jgi:hypothetical protein
MIIAFITKLCGLQFPHVSFRINLIEKFGGI